MSDPRFSRPWWRSQLFRLLAAVAPSSRRKDQPLPKHPQRILVLLPVLRGDYLVASPLLAALSHAHPRAELCVLVTRASEELARHDPNVDRTILYRKLPGWPLSLWQLLRLRPEVVVLPKGHPAFTEALVLVLTRAPYRVGLAHPHLDKLLTHSVSHAWESEHRTAAFCRLLGPFGFDPAAVSRRLHIGKNPRAEERAELLLEKIRRPLLAINVSASSPARRWTEDKWRQLLATLCARPSSPSVLLLGAPLDQELLNRLAAPHEDVHALATGSFLEASGVVARSQLLLTVDTGIVQAAAARGVPMVALYNGDHEVYLRFAPQTVPHRAVLAARGQWVEQISLEQVLLQLDQLMTELSLS